MADLKTTKEINKELEKQQKLLKNLDNDSVKYKNTQKEIVRLQELAFKARQKEGAQLASQQPLFKQIESSIQGRLKKAKEFATQESKAATLQKESQKAQGRLLQNIQGQVTHKNELNEASSEQLEVLESLNLGQNDIAGLQAQIAASEKRITENKLKAGPLVQKDEKALKGILEGEVKRVQQQQISKKLTSMADKATGGLASKAKSFKEGITANPKLAALGVAGVLVGFLVKAATQFSKKIDAVGETFGFMTNTNKEFRNDLIDSGNEAMMVGKNLGDVLAVTSQLSSEFGITLKESQDIAGTVLDTAVATGISNDEATKLFGTFMKIGGLTSDQAENLIESTAQLAAQKGVAPKAVLQDMASSAEEIAGFTKGTGENIAEAAVQARQMGLSLSTTAKIAEGLLDFESSIANEIEASVMIGRQLNFQKARQLALDGDIAGATKNIVDQVGSEAEFNKLNFLQRKSLAKSIGVSVTEMKKLVSASDKLTLSGALAGEKFDDLVGQDALSGLTSIINSLKMVGAAVMDEIGKPIAEMLKAFQESVMTPEGMKKFKNDIIGFVNSVGSFINGMTGFANWFIKEENEIGKIGKLPLVNDFKSDPGQITHIMGPKGMARLNPRDSVMGTTNRINDGFITGDEGSFANFKELVEAQRDLVLATTNPIPVNDFSLNPRDSVMGTTNPPDLAPNFERESAMQKPVGLTKDDIKTAFSEALSIAELTSRIEHGDLIMGIDSGLGGRR